MDCKENRPPQEKDRGLKRSADGDPDIFPSEDPSAKEDAWWTVPFLLHGQIPEDRVPLSIEFSCPGKKKECYVTTATSVGKVLPDFVRSANVERDPDNDGKGQLAATTHIIEKNDFLKLIHALGSLVSAGKELFGFSGGPQLAVRCVHFLMQYGDDKQKKWLFAYFIAKLDGLSSGAISPLAFGPSTAVQMVAAIFYYGIEAAKPTVRKFLSRVFSGMGTDISPIVFCQEQVRLLVPAFVYLVETNKVDKNMVWILPNRQPSAEEITESLFPELFCLSWSTAASESYHPVVCSALSLQGTGHPSVEGVYERNLCFPNIWSKAKPGHWNGKICTFFVAKKPGSSTWVVAYAEGSNAIIDNKTVVLKSSGVLFQNWMNPNGPSGVPPTHGWVPTSSYKESLSSFYPIVVHKSFA